MSLTEEQRGTVGFDLKKAWEAVHTLENFAFASGKITAGQIQDVLWGTRLLAASAAEIERLREIIDSPTEEESWKAGYGLFLCAARKWHDAYRKAHNSNLLRKQENERLRAENLELQVAVLGPDGIRANQACIIADQAARISDFEIEIAELKADLEQSERVVEARLDVIDQQAARIKGREDQVRNWTETAREYAVNTDYWRDRAKKAEGKIGLGTPCWQITEERKAALWHAIKVLKENDIMEEPEEHLWDEEVTVLQAMLTEAGQE